jgi:hypothetical protein
MVQKCLQHDTVPGVMVKGSAGQRDTVVHADGAIQFIGDTNELWFKIKTGELPWWCKQHELQEMDGRPYPQYSIL